MNSTHFCFTGIVLFILMSVAITTAAPSDRLDTILDRGSIIIAIEPLGAPYGSLVSGEERRSGTHCPGDCYTENQLTGFDISLTGAIARRLGVEACYSNPEYASITNGNWSGWDLYTGYYITNNRLQTLFFTRPILSESSRFYIRNNETSITGPADLTGKIVGVGNQTAQLQYLKNTLDIPGMVNQNLVIDPFIEEYTDEYDALNALISGSVDGILISELSGQDAIANGSPIMGLDPVAFTGYSGLSFLKASDGDAKSLVEKLDEIIADMHKTGELSKISTTYLGKDFTKESGSFNVSSLNQTFG